MNRNATIRRLAMVPLAAAAMAGCQGHGKYTTEALEQAQGRMSSIQAATRWDLAHQQFLAGDLRKALDNIADSVEMDPGVEKSHHLHGRILLELGQLEKAIGAFDKAVEIDETFAEAHYYKGIVLERLGDYRAARESYETASLLEPEDPQFAIAEAETLIFLDRLDQAEEILTTRARSYMQNPGVLQTLAHIKLLRDDPAGAVSMFREARLLASDDVSILEDLAMAQMLAGDWVEAEYNLRKLMENKGYGSRTDLRQMQARCLAAVDRPVEARSILLELTQKSSGASDYSLWIDLGKVALTLNDTHRVRLSAARAVAMAPDRHEGHLLRAAGRVRTGDLEKALESLNTAVSLTDADPRPALMRGVVLQRLGRDEAAAESFALAASIDPGDDRARRLLADVPIDD